jgi:thiamine transport system ATP-binding protein
MLKLDQIIFSYGQGAGYGFDLEVRPGEIVGIKGASGSGKSTLLDLIAGFQIPSAGTMQLDQTDLLPLMPEDRPVSILFQKDNVFAHLTARENVLLGTPKGTDALSALKEVGLEDHQNQKCANLSGGQQQRVALARTLARNKPILLLDEPFSALDDDTAQTMRALVKKLVKANNWCTLLVSHQRADFNALADKVLLLQDGQLTPEPV